MKIDHIITSYYYNSHVKNIYIINNSLLVTDGLILLLYLTCVTFSGIYLLNTL